MSDWITNFLDYTAAIPSPASFRLWSAITAISGVLERKVWIQTAQSFLYPNLFTLLVGPPATGKTQAIKQEQVPVPPPKVRAGIETRYRRGQWEKYLKSKGWVAA